MALRAPVTPGRLRPGARGLKSWVPECGLVGCRGALGGGPRNANIVGLKLVQGRGIFQFGIVINCSMPEVCNNQKTFLFKELEA